MTTIYKISGKKVPDLYVTERRTAETVEKYLQEVTGGIRNLKVTQVDVYDHNETIANFMNAAEAKKSSQEQQGGK